MPLQIKTSDQNQLMSLTNIDWDTFIQSTLPDIDDRKNTIWVITKPIQTQAEFLTELITDEVNIIQLDTTSPFATKLSQKIISKELQNRPIDKTLEARPITINGPIPNSLSTRHIFATILSDEERHQFVTNLITLFQTPQALNELQSDPDMTQTPLLFDIMSTDLEKESQQFEAPDYQYIIDLLTMIHNSER